MSGARRWATARVGYVETLRALFVAGGARSRSAGRFRADWGRFDVVELDGGIAEQAAVLSASEDLRSLDAIHLASALALPVEDLTLACWDRRLHAAARNASLRVLPERL